MMYSTLLPRVHDVFRVDFAHLIGTPLADPVPSHLLRIPIIPRRPVPDAIGNPGPARLRSYVLIDRIVADFDGYAPDVASGHLTASFPDCLSVYSLMFILTFPLNGAIMMLKGG